MYAILRQARFYTKHHVVSTSNFSILKGHASGKIMNLARHLYKKKYSEIFCLNYAVLLIAKKNVRKPHKPNRFTKSKQRQNKKGF